MLLTERRKIEDERFKKAIPSKVFYNHFFAINYHLMYDDQKYNLKKIDYYNRLKVTNQDFDIDVCKKLFCNSWNTEYAFNLAKSVDDNEFYKCALHWHFPQAYYSIYLAMTAFHETQGIANEQHEKSIKLFGNSVRCKHYPDVISFFSHGSYKDFKFENLGNTKIIPNGFSALSGIYSLQDAQEQIASFLKSTRVQNAENKRKRGESSHKKDPRFQTQKGTFTSVFNKKHWSIVYKTIPETTIFNLMYRLRIKANYQDINSFIDADIDFKTFHECLSNLIDYINFVHEAYFCKSIGKDKYEKVLYEFKDRSLSDKPIERYEKHIRGLH